MFAFVAGGITVAASQAASSLAKRMVGRILLQVENRGEAWYVDPQTLTRSYLGRPSDCFNVMRSKGLGITNADLTQISIYANTSKYTTEEFSLQFPDSWSSKSVLKDNVSFGIMQIPTYNFILNGASMFTISIFSKDQWNSMLPNPGSLDVRAVGNDGTVYVSSISNDLPSTNKHMEIDDILATLELR